jgi:hypothetical protein
MFRDIGGGSEYSRFTFGFEYAVVGHLPLSKRIRQFITPGPSGHRSAFAVLVDYYFNQGSGHSTSPHFG